MSMITTTGAVFNPTDPGSPLSKSPSETAVLLMDYQNLVVTKLGPVGDSVLNVAAQLRDWALYKGMPVFHCLVDTGARPAPQSKLSARWKWYEDKLAATPALGRENEAIAPLGQNDWEMTFLRAPGLVSALESNGILEALEEKGIKSLVLCGVSTSGCVLSTTRAATDRGYIVTVAEDACFDSVPGLHGMLVTQVLPTTAHVATARELMDAWKIL
ncbi:uncharacterized protein Z518_04463 [Rhinocladiella mackenziei CBS 650.93]|uniref:Rhinocladiella mackenziei CBS 650.93 unplaced genomic scaffold supercont1.3, whole genome shotgun sequence n=1 Tax=Rhinocladiella mackenziei CBS 650.93 TaxID=1442369 RepID=A0A0D2FWD9_9EURO|nr:uncharacterized protein Z518_04463 [Rhinocladiella mackenziei CBS 650.93]KIX06487.1 hypothetical protein Z518_04463 [Rhinocladiella mackenziei CBS 650.93]